MEGSTSSTRSETAQFVCMKGLLQLKELNKEKLQEGKRLGIYRCGIKILLSETHLEFIVVLESLPSESEGMIKDGQWNGFYFCGQTKNLEKCFQHRYLSLSTIVSLVKENLSKTNLNPDPYATPLLIIGEDQKQQAFWQVTSPERPDKVVGFIPLLLRTQVFHDSPDYPLISFKKPDEIHSSPIFILATDIDRNILLPEKQELDVLFSQMLHKLLKLLQNNNWKVIVLPSQDLSTESSIYTALKKMDNKQFKIVSNLFIATRKGRSEKIDYSSLHITASGRAYVKYLVKTLTVFDDENINARTSVQYKAIFDNFLTEMEELQKLFTKDVAIFNPFLKGGKSILSTSYPIPVQFKDSSDVLQKLEKNLSNSQLVEPNAVPTQNLYPISLDQLLQEQPLQQVVTNPQQTHSSISIFSQLFPSSTSTSPIMSPVQNRQQSQPAVSSQPPPILKRLEDAIHIRSSGNIPSEEPVIRIKSRELVPSEPVDVDTQKLARILGKLLANTP